MMQVAAHEISQPMPLAQLLGSPNCEGGATLISGIELDSRRIRRGDLFLAMPGDVHDGRHFIEQAVANGAAAVAAEAPVAGFVDSLPVPLVEVPELVPMAKPPPVACWRNWGAAWINPAG